MIEQIDLLDVNEQAVTTHVFGLGIDDEVSYRIENLATPEDLWSHRDDLNSLTSITDINGDVKERYEYGDYGKVAMFDGAGLALPASAFEVVHLYTGRSLIAGTGLYDYRFRVMEPETGRFVQRDPLWTFDSLNLYQYALSIPVNLVDPYGLASGTVFTTPPAGGGGIDYSSPGLQDIHYLGPSGNRKNNGGPALRHKGPGSVGVQFLKKANPITPAFYYDRYIDKLREGIENMATDVGLCRSLQQLDDLPGGGIGQGGGL